MTWRSHQVFRRIRYISTHSGKKKSVKLPLEWSKWAAIHDMMALAKDGIEVRNLLRVKPPLVEPAQPIYEQEIPGETEAQRKN